MKKLSLILSVAIAAILLQAHSCHKHDRDYPSVCGEVACTMEFAMVTVDVRDTLGRPVVLDDAYTIRLYNDEKIVSQSSIPDSGTYTVLDDNFISALMNRTEGFRFIGKKNGVELVNEEYQITGDCCHVHKDSGKSNVVVR
jgi:hypothetical protein